MANLPCACTAFQQSKRSPKKVDATAAVDDYIMIGVSYTMKKHRKKDALP